MEPPPELLTQNLWERYGFAGNPFDTSPLPINYGQGLSVVNAYVPRTGLAAPGDLMRNFLRNPGGGRIVVEGEPGVGKTTFVNYHRYEWELHAKRGLLSPVSPISVEKSWSGKDFVLALLNSLASRIRLDKRPAAVAKDELLQEVAAITGVRREKDGGFGLNVSAPALGGLGLSRSRKESLKATEISLLHLREYLTRLVAKARDELGFGGVIFHLENMELLRQKDGRALREFFEDIRDSIQEPHVYFVFVGYRGMFQQVIVPAPRVRSIFFDLPLDLEPLSREQVHAIILRRYELLAAPGKNWIKPIEDAVIGHFYEAFAGRIRYVMNAVTSLISHLPDSYAGTLTLAQAAEILKAIQQSEIKARLTTAEIEVFQAAIRLRRFTPTALAQATGKSKQLIQKHLSKLQELGFVYPAEKSGRSQFYEREPRFSFLAS